MDELELLDLIATALRQLDDPRIHEVLLDCDSGDGTLIVSCLDGTDLALSSSAIEVGGDPDPEMAA